MSPNNQIKIKSDIIFAHATISTLCARSRVVSKYVDAGFNLFCKIIYLFIDDISIGGGLYSCAFVPYIYVESDDSNYIQC